MEEVFETWIMGTEVLNFGKEPANQNDLWWSSLPKHTQCSAFLSPNVIICNSEVRFLIVSVSGSHSMCTSSIGLLNCRCSNSVI